MSLFHKFRKSSFQPMAIILFPFALKLSAACFGAWYPPGLMHMYVIKSSRRLFLPVCGCQHYYDLPSIYPAAIIGCKKVAGILYGCLHICLCDSIWWMLFSWRKLLCYRLCFVKTVLGCLNHRQAGPSCYM